MKWIDVNTAKFGVWICGDGVDEEKTKRLEPD